MRKEWLFLFILLLFLIPYQISHWNFDKNLEIQVEEVNATDSNSSISLKIISTPDVNPPDSNHFGTVWEHNYTRGVNDMGRSVVECSDGGFALVGGSITGSYDNDVWLIRTDDLGIPLWNRTFNFSPQDAGMSIIECGSGGFAICGYTYGSGYKDLLVIRTNTTGHSIWHRSFGGAENDFGFSIVECSSGGFVIGGMTASTGGGDAWLFRIDASGNHLWNKTFSGYLSGDYGYDVVECNSGGFALIGYTHVSGYASQVWLIRTDVSGNHLWNHTYGGLNVESGRALLEMENGDFVIAGFTQSTPSGFQDVLLIRTDSNGNQVWNRTFGGSISDEANSLHLCDDGGFVLSGYTRSFGAGDKDVWVIRTNSTGHQLWNQTYGYATVEDSFSIIECSDGGFVLLGEIGNSTIGEYTFWFIKIPSELYWLQEPFDQSFELGTTLSYDLNVSSYYGIDTWWINDTTNFSINSLGIISNVTPLDVGTYGLEVEVNDTTDNVLLSSFKIFVVDTTPPIWQQIPMNQLLGPRDKFRYDLNASDISGLSRWWLNDTAHFDIDDNGIITNTTLLEEGVRGLEISVNDTYNNILIAVFSVMTDLSPPTWIGPPSDQTVEFGNSVSYDLDAWDISGLDTWWVNDTSNFSINSQGLITNTSILPVGNYNLQVYVNDTLDNILTAPFVIHIRDSTSPIWISPPTDQILEIGQAFVQDVDAFDLSGIASFWINDTANFVVDGFGRISNATRLSVGIYWLEIRAYDPHSNYISATFKVTVQDSIDPTWDESPVDQILEFGFAFYYIVNASDPGGISFYWVNDTTHFTIDINGKLTNAFNLVVGIYGIELRAYDFSNNYCQAVIQVIVEDTIAPTWVIEPMDQTLDFGEYLDYQLGAIDISGIADWMLNDTTYFSITSTGRLTSVGLLEPGSYGLNITVADAYGNENAKVITITVLNPPTPLGPPIPGFPFEAIIVGFVSALTIGILVQKHRKHDTD